MSLAVCVTVRNEAAVARELAANLLRQTRQPDELVIVDGGSTDGTTAILRELLATVEYARVVDLPGANISAGRNAAIARTSAELVAVTDAGIDRSDTWLEALVAAAEANPQSAGSFGFVLAAPHTAFEAAVGAIALPLAGEPDAALYPPSSGSVLIRRSWLERAGGYPDWLDYGEDLWLDRRIWSLGGWFAHASGADVGIRPRSTPREFARQYFNYAAGDGRAGMMTVRHVIRFGAYGLAAAVARRPNPARLALLLALGVAYLNRPTRRLPSLLARTPGADPLVAALWLPGARLIGDIAKMVGVAAGLKARLF